MPAPSARPSCRQSLRVMAVAVSATLATCPAQALDYNWFSGDYGAAGLPSPIGANDVVVAQLGTAKTLSSSLVNNGRINWRAGAGVNGSFEFFGNTTVLRNNGLFDQQTDGAFFSYSTATFDNNGVLRKSGGGGDLVVAIALTNRAGALLQADAGRIVYAYPALFEAGTQFRGAGRHVLNAELGNFVFGGDFTGDGRIDFASGFYTTSASTKPQTDINWTGGTFSGAWTIDSGRTLAATGNNGKAIARTLVNNGTIAWSTTSALEFYNDTTVLRNNGLFNQQTDGAFFSYATATFDNNGVLRKSGGSGDLVVAIALTNRAGALLQADAGRIVYAYPAVFEAGTQFRGAGRHVLNAELGNFVFGGDFTGDGRIDFASGFYTTSASTKPQTDINWTGGTFSGAWTIDSGRTLAATGNNGKAIARTLVNNGTIAWSTTTALEFYNDTTVLRNNGLFDQKTDGSLFTYSAATLDNTGVLRKSGGSGDFFIGSRLVNTGAIESLSGTIRLPAGWRNDGIVRGVAAYQTTVLTNAGTVSPGATAGPEAATLTLNGNFVNDRTGTLTFDVGAAGLSDKFVVTGIAEFAGRVVVRPLAGYIAEVGDTFRVMTFAGRVGLLDDLQAFGFEPDITFTAVYSDNALDIRVTAVPEPATTASMLAGLALLAFALRRKNA